MTKSVLGIVGGSGLYDIPALSNMRWEAVSSPWGAPSDQILFAEIDGLPIRFLPRHGRGHKVPPSAIDYRANIDALKRAGVTDLVSVSACGSLKEEFAPGHFVLVDQFIDRTFAREKSFFGAGLRRARVDGRSRQPAAGRSWSRRPRGPRASPHTRGGTYLVMEGPQFSTRAESNLYRSWGCDVIGMTNMPEAKLAREAEICYATVAMVTDYDCWHARARRRRRRRRHQGAAAPTSTRRTALIERLARDFPREHPRLPDRLGPRARRRHHHAARTPAIPRWSPSSMRWRDGC